MALHSRTNVAPGAAQVDQGIGITGLVAALVVAIVAFVAQMAMFLYFRTQRNLHYIYNPKHQDVLGAKQLLSRVIWEKDRDIVRHCGWDTYYFLRYLGTLLWLFIPILLVVLPLLGSLNYVGGRHQDANDKSVTGLDTFAFGNVKPSNASRYTAHALCAVLATGWFCYVALSELRDHQMKRLENNVSMDRELRNQQGLIIDLGRACCLVSAQKLQGLLERRDQHLADYEAAAAAAVAATTLAHRDDPTCYKTHVRTAECGEKLETSEAAIERHDMPQANNNQSTQTDTCWSCVAAKSSWHNIVWSNVGLVRSRRLPRAAATAVILSFMVLLWAVPVSATAALGQLDNVIRNNTFQSILHRHSKWTKVAESVAGVLPTVALTLLLAILPRALVFLSWLRGCRFKFEQAAFVQRFYFIFLFIQMFLIVSIASFFTASLKHFLHNLGSLRSVQDVLRLLSGNLPTAANYFFSYLLLQALSSSASAVMQLTPLLWHLADTWSVCAPRRKWSRGLYMDVLAWGEVLPPLTTLACISLAYCIMAPLICLFAVLSFGMLWLAHRYCAIFVSRMGPDHGGILYPRAINQTFTGLYTMHLCLAGLFLGVRDEAGRQVCLVHAIVIMAALALTAAFQIALNAWILPKMRINHHQQRQNSDENKQVKLADHLALVRRRKTVWLPKHHSDVILSAAPKSVATKRGWEAVFDGFGNLQLHNRR